MKLPFVWRSEHEATLEKALARLDQHTQDADRHLAAVDQAMERLERQAAAAIQAFNTQREQSERDMVRAEARYAELMRNYQLLRVQGHVPAPEPAKPMEKPDIVTQAINIASHGDPELRDHMLKFADAERLVNPEMTDIELVQRIRRGNRPAEEYQ